MTRTFRASGWFSALCLSSLLVGSQAWSEESGKSGNFRSFNAAKSANSSSFNLNKGGGSSRSFNPAMNTPKNFSKSLGTPGLNNSSLSNYNKPLNRTFTQQGKNLSNSQNLNTNTGGLNSLNTNLNRGKGTRFGTNPGKSTLGTGIQSPIGPGSMAGTGIKKTVPFNPSGIGLGNLGNGKKGGTAGLGKTVPGLTGNIKPVVPGTISVDPEKWGGVKKPGGLIGAGALNPGIVDKIDPAITKPGKIQDIGIGKDDLVVDKLPDGVVDGIADGIGGGGAEPPVADAPEDVAPVDPPVADAPEDVAPADPDPADPVDPADPPVDEHADGDHHDHHDGHHHDHHHDHCFWDIDVCLPHFHSHCWHPVDHCYVVWVYRTDCWVRETYLDIAPLAYELAPEFIALAEPIPYEYDETLADGTIVHKKGVWWMGADGLPHGDEKWSIVVMGPEMAAQFAVENVVVAP